MAEFTKITSEDRADKGVSGLPDTPDMTAAKLQERFDSLANLAIDAINRLSHELGLDSAASKIGTANGTLQSWISSCQTAVQQNTRNISANSLAITSLETDTSNLAEQISTLKTGHESLANTYYSVDKVPSTLLDLKNRVGDLEKNYDSASESISTLIEKNANIENQMSAYAQSISNIEQDMSTDSDRIKGLEDKLGESKYTPSQLSDEVDDIHYILTDIQTDSQGNKYTTLGDTITDILNRLSALEGGTTV